MTDVQIIPIKNCWLCGSPVAVCKNNTINVIQCDNCYKHGIIVKCEDINEYDCIKKWNQSKTLLTDDDIANITISVSKDPNSNIELIRKLNNINAHNTHYNTTNSIAKRFGYGAIIDPLGKIDYCTRPHIDVLLKYFNIDYDTLDPKNVGNVFDTYEKILSSNAFVNNFVKIILFMTILKCDIPKNHKNCQIMKLIDYLNDLKKCYTSINKIEIHTEDIELIEFSTFDTAIEYLLRFIHA